MHAGSLIFFDVLMDDDVDDGMDDMLNDVVGRWINCFHRENLVFGVGGWVVGLMG